MKNYLYLILAVTLTACSSTSTKNKNYDAYVKAVSSEPPMVLNDREIRKEAQQGIDQLITDGKSYTKHAKLVEQLKRTSCKLDLKSVGVETMTPSEIYQQRIKSVVLVGVIHHCNSKTCKRNHYNPASGVIIHEDGVVLTNYHVVDSKVKNVMGMAVTTVDGKVYFVDEVLAASKGDDVAILKLKDAKGFFSIFG